MPELDLLDPTRERMGFVHLPAELLSLIESAPLPGLGDGPQCAATARTVERLLNQFSWQGSPLEAGLWLLAGELERSHAVSQQLATREGSYWHAIMHRREGDFWNSKYWLRRVGNHPVLGQLAETIARNASRLAGIRGDDLPIEPLHSPAQVAPALVDLVERAVTDKTGWQPGLQRVGWWEWQLLFLHCAAGVNWAPSGSGSDGRPERKRS